MPSLILEVLSLQLRLPDNPEASTASSDMGTTATHRTRASSAAAAVAIGLWCEVAPSWDPSSAAAFNAAEATPTSGGKWLEWCHSIEQVDDVEQFIGDAQSCEQPKPLVAYLVSVPPPGGIASLATHMLHVQLLLPAGKGAWAPASFSLPLELPLRPMLCACSGLAVSLPSKQLALDVNSDVSAVVWAAWRPSRPGIEQLLDLPFTPKPPPRPTVASRQSSSKAPSPAAMPSLPRSARRAEKQGTQEQTPVAGGSPRLVTQAGMMQRRMPVRPSSASSASSARRRPTNWRAEQLHGNADGAADLLLRRMADQSAAKRSAQIYGRGKVEGSSIRLSECSPRTTPSAAMTSGSSGRLKLSDRGSTPSFVIPLPGA
eukprot:TRINITY_DN62294_c0_g1_i1.p1 TRINITY_DN62294_c0_g1~~TRINITY_DN62294_c0_g1_i1.p1  ORF type:complete len:391 (+),score=82.62 TRINITY_DN62294_c0_g1_i1:57-1175(+)